MGDQLKKGVSMTGRDGSDTVRVAAVGCGYWGKNLVRNFAELGALAAVVDPDREVAANIAKQFNTTAREWQSVLEDVAIDGVVIAAPAALHYQLAREALEAGKHVFVEKPLALNTQDA